MLPIRSYRLIPLLLLTVLLLAVVWPSAASAQRAVVRPAPARSVVVYGGFGYGYGYGYPFYPYYYPYYSPWFGWGPYPYPYPFGYGYPMYDALTSSIKLEVTPKNAEVFVDGYRAGVVDNFDGVFQRLRVQPGAREIVLFLDGYRTVRQSFYLSAGGDQKVHYAMEKLGPGEVSEPPPLPVAGSPNDDPTVQPQGPGPGPQQQGPMGPPPPAGRTQPGAPTGPPPAGNAARTFGTLSIRVQPADAEILIDGERWSAPVGQDRTSVELSEGRHHVEIRKAGFNQYTEDVLIRRGVTLPLNVSLLHGDGN